MPTLSPAPQPERSPPRRALAFPYADRHPIAGGPSEVAAARRRAHARFHELGLPSVRVEAWKYTNLQALAKLELAPADGLPAIDLDRLANLLPPDLDADRIVIGNGGWRGDLVQVSEQIPGVELLPLAVAAEQMPAPVAASLSRSAAGDRPMAALNAAFAGDGAVIRLGEGVRLTRPLHLVFINQGGDVAPAIQARVIVLAEAGSAITVIESHVGQGEGAYWANPVIDLEIRDGATVRHLKLQEEGPAAFHLGFTEARLARGGTYEHLLLSIGGRLARNELRALLTAEDGSVVLNGAYLARGRQHVDNTTDIVHKAPHCRSREVYKGALDGQSRGVFQGRIAVEPDAQGTDGHQLNRTILLSETAEIDAKPMLEIYADDVKCSHGATAGALDPDWLHYLRARGIGEAEARRMLVEGFLGEIMEAAPHSGLVALGRARVAAWLADGEGGR